MASNPTRKPAESYGIEVLKQAIKPLSNKHSPNFSPLDELFAIAIAEILPGIPHFRPRTNLVPSAAVLRYPWEIMKTDFLE